MKGVVSLLVAVASAVIAALALGWAGGGLGAASARASLAAGGAVGLLAWFSLSRKTGPEWETKPPHGPIAWGVVIVFALFSLRAFCWLVYFRHGEVAFLSPNNLGDLSLHCTFTRYLASGIPFWPQNPIYAAEPLRYPFGVDLFNALLLGSGADLFRGFIWVGLAGAAATGLLLWRWGGPFVLAGFLFNGGLAGWRIFQTGHLEDFQSEMAWKSIPLALFVTQRGLLYAIPAGLTLLWSWRARFFRRERGLPLWIEVLLYGTMPIFHLHTFLFLSVMLGSWFLLSWCGPLWRGEPGFRASLVRLVGWAFVPATALVWLLTDGFRSGGLIYLKPGWMQEGRDPLAFWLENFGILPFCVLALLLWFWERGRKGNGRELAGQTAMVLPALALFLIGCFVMFAPWEWDNTKIFLWCYLAVLPALWAMLRATGPWLRAALCVLLFFSGFVSLAGGIDRSHTGHTLAQRRELDLLQGPLARLPATATFACAPTYNHPLLLLGRKVVEGYEGHLSSHGIRYKANKAALESLLRGEPGWQERARALGVDYLFWGTREEKSYGPMDPIDPMDPANSGWGARAPLVIQGEWGKIYDLRAPKDTPGTSVKAPD